MTCLNKIKLVAKRRFFLVFLLSAVFFIFPLSYVFAKTNLINFYKPSNISGADRYYVGNLSKFPGVSTTNFNISGLNRGQIVSAATTSMLNNQDGINLVEFSGHGDPKSYYTASGFPMYDQIRMATEAAQAANAQVITLVDCCGSGNIANFAQNPSNVFGDGLNNVAAISSSAPGRSSYVGGGGSIAERLAYYRSHVSAVDSNKNPLYDKIGDGILSVGELRDAMAKDGLKNQFVIPPGNEGAPVFAANPEALAEYNKKWLGLCVVVKPGQDKEFGNMYGTPGVGSYDGAHLDINGKKETKGIEDELNYKLRKDNFGCLSTSPTRGSTDAGTMPGCDENKTDGSNYDIVEKAAKDGKAVSWVSGGKYKPLSRSQAETSLGNRVHAYTVPDGKLMQPSVYTKGSTAKDANEQPVHVVREDCKFITPPVPSPMPSQQPDSGNAGGNIPNTNGGQGNNGNQQQNPRTSPSPNPSASPTPIPGAICSQEYAPVCDEKLQTQPNRCVANQKGVKILRDGACTNDTGTITDLSATISKLITQSLASGIPENAIANTIKTIITLVRGVYNGTNSLVTSVIK